MPKSGEAHGTGLRQAPGARRRGRGRGRWFASLLGMDRMREMASARAWLGKNLAVIFGLGGVLALFAVFLLWPRATVVVLAPVSEVRREFTITASTSVGRVDTEGARVPARVVEGSFEASVLVPVSGLIRSGATRARGVVTLANESSRPVHVPKGTAVETTGGVRFRTVADVTVPASSVRYYMNAAVDSDVGLAEAEVEAEEPGTRGNVAAGRITVVVDDTLPSLGVVNPEPTSGGEDAVTPAVSDRDLATARKRLTAEVAAVAASRLGSNVPPGFRMLAETIVTEHEEPVFTHAPFTPSTELGASCRARAKALAVREADVFRAAKGLFHLVLDAEGTRMVSPEVDVEMNGAKRTDAGTATIEVTARGLVTADVDPDRLAVELAGKTVEEAESLLKTSYGRGISIRQSRDSASRLPRFAWWIRVDVQRQEEEGF